MKKKMLIILLSALLTFSAFVPITGAQESGFEPETQRVIDFVKAFSLMNELSVDDVQNKTSLTRAQFATIISRILIGEKDEISVGVLPFTDVPEWAQAQVYFVYSQGIMVGDGEGRFMPNEAVTYGQAAKVFIHLLGYDAQALKRGGFPVGYINIASQLDLLDGIDADAYAAISRYNIAKILYQAVGVEVQNIYSISDERAKLTTDGRDYLDVYLGIKSGEGILGAINGKRAVKNVLSLKGHATFGDTVAYVTDARYDELLGNRVKYFLKSVGDEYELVYLEEHEKNVVTRIKGRDILKDDPEFSMSNFVYDAGEDKESIELIDEFHYVYNGVYNFDFDWDAFPIETGYVDLIDHDDDSVIDVVMIWNFEEILVNKVSENIILGVHFDRFDISSYGDNVTITFPDGSIGTKERLSELKMWDVVSIAKSLDNKWVNLIVCRDGVSGVVEEKSTTTDEAFVIDGREYFLSKHFSDSMKNGFAEKITLGQGGEFYFNVVGEIAGIRSKKSDTELQYGFLLGVNEPKGISDCVGMLIIDTSGKKTEFFTEEEIRFTGENGVKAKSNAKDAILGSDLCPSGQFEPQLIQYRLNEDGNVAEIECAIAGNSVMFDLDRFSKDYEAGEDGFFYNDHSYGFCSSLNGLHPEFWPGGTSTIFYVPMQDGKVIKEDSKVISTNYFKNGEQYKNLIFYDNDETMVSNVIVYQPDVAEVSETFKESDVLVLVDKVVTAIDSKDEVDKVLKCYSGGSYQTMKMINNSNIELNYGDIIYAKYNPDGEIYIDASSVIFRNNGEYPLYTKENHASPNSNGFSECWSTNGIVYRKSENHLTVYCGKDINEKSVFRTISLGRNTPLVYLVGANGKVRMGKIDDIISSSAVLQTDGSIAGEIDGSKVFLNTRIDYIREIFIFED